MPALRRSLTVVVAALMALLPVLSASASTADDLDAAKQHLADARAAASDARAAAHDAEVKLQETEDHIAEVEQTHQRSQGARRPRCTTIVRKRALYAYTHAGNDIDVVIGTDDPLSAARGKTLIDQANQKDNTAVKRLAAINSDLRDQTTELRDEESQATQREGPARRAQRRVRGRARRRASRDRRAPGEVRRRRSPRRRKRRARRSSNGSAPRCEQRSRSRERSRTSVPVQSSQPEPRLVANPGGGSFMCPVFGAAYTDDYGGSRGHPGIDMFVPIGTQAIAVKAGHRALRPERRRGRQHRVPAGERRELVLLRAPVAVRGRPALGVTGRGDRPHRDDRQRERSRTSTSRSGSAATTASRIDPYPTLKSAGC